MHRNLHSTDEDASRGQMLLIGALIITFSLVVLVLLLNNVLFVQNIESEGVSAQAVETAETRQLVRQNTGEVLIRMNAGEFGSDAADYVAGNVSTMLELVSNNSKAEHGTAISLVGLETVDGTLVRQTDGGNFTNRTEGATDWHLAETAAVRRFQLRVDRGSLNDPGGLLGDLLGDSDGAFHVNVSDGTDTWSLFVYAGGSSDEEIVVSTARNGGSAVERYRAETPNATVALTTGRVDGEHAFEFAPNVDPPYDIRFGNGGAAEGNYTATFNDSAATTINGTNVDIGGSTAPYSTPGVYAVDLSIQQTSVRATYTGSMLVAPCRPGNETCPRDLTLGAGGSSPTGTNPGSNPPNPSIESVTTNGGDTKVEVDWNATDDKNLGGGANDENQVRLVGDGNVEATKDINPSGTSDSGSIQFTGISSSKYSDWKVVLVVTDSDGNTETTEKDVPF